MNIKPIQNRVSLVIIDDGTNSEYFGASNILRLRDDTPATNIHKVKDEKHPGIRPRWGIVIGTSKEAEEAGIRVGDKIIVEHGRWSRGIEVKNKDGRRYRYWTCDIQYILGKEDKHNLSDREKEAIARLFPEMKDEIVKIAEQP